MNVFGEQLAQRLRDDRKQLDYLKDQLSLLSGGQIGILEHSFGGGKVSTVHARIDAERSDGTETLLLAAPSLNIKGQSNICGMAFVLALAKQFRDLKFWGRDLIILFPGVGASTRSEIIRAVDEWIHNYNGRSTDPLLIASGIPQAGLVIEMENDPRLSISDNGAQNIENIHQCSVPFADPEIHIEGFDGILPNLDLVNVLGMIERHRAGDMRLFPNNSLQGTLHRFVKNIPYLHDLLHLAGGIFRQATGSFLFAHAPLLRYRVDAVTVSFRPVPQEHSNEFTDKSMFEYLIHVV